MARMAVPNSRAARVSTAPKELGRTWRSSTRCRRTPDATAASTNSSVRARSTSERMTRAMRATDATPDGDGDVDGAEAEHGDHGEGQQQRGDGHQHVDGAHEGVVDPAAEVAGEEADRACRRPGRWRWRSRPPAATGRRRRRRGCRRRGPRWSVPNQWATLGACKRCRGTPTSGFWEREPTRRERPTEHDQDEQRRPAQPRAGADQPNRRGAATPCGPRPPAGRRRRCRTTSAGSYAGDHLVVGDQDPVAHAISFNGPARRRERRGGRARRGAGRRTG